MRILCWLDLSVPARQSVGQFDPKTGKQVPWKLVFCNNVDARVAYHGTVRLIPE